MNLYQQVIIDEFNHPQNKGKLSPPCKVGQTNNQSCGDDIQVFIKTKQDKIIDIKWQGNGCAISQAAMSLLTQSIKEAGLDIQQVLELNQGQLLDMLGLKQISLGREKCLMMGLYAIHKAIKKS